LLADGIRLPFSGSGEFGTSPFFEQLSVKAIRLTVRQRTLFSSCAKGQQNGSSRLHPADSYPTWNFWRGCARGGEHEVCDRRSPHGGDGIGRCMLD
jgi:hypothetical protein